MFKCLKQSLAEVNYHRTGQTDRQTHTQPHLLKTQKLFQVYLTLLRVKLVFPYPWNCCILGRFQGRRWSRGSHLTPITRVSLLLSSQGYCHVSPVTRIRMSHCHSICHARKKLVPPVTVLLFLPIAYKIIIQFYSTLFIQPDLLFKSF